jgi:hypothetical protein
LHGFEAAHCHPAVETIGDCLVVAGGLLHKDADGVHTIGSSVDPDHANKTLALAIDMLAAAASSACALCDCHSADLVVRLQPCPCGWVGGPSRTPALLALPPQWSCLAPDPHSL